MSKILKALLLALLLHQSGVLGGNVFTLPFPLNKSGKPTVEYMFTFRIQDPGSRLLDPGSRALDKVSWIISLGVSWMPLVRPELPPNAYFMYFESNNTTVGSCAGVAYHDVLTSLLHSHSHPLSITWKLTMVFIRSCILVSHFARALTVCRGS